MELNALDFREKTVWVTGAHQGIGHEVACAFVRLGAKVIGFDKQFSTRENRAGFAAVPLDLADPAQIHAVVAEASTGGETPHILVHAAGILHVGTVETLSPAQWHETFDVNVTSAFYLLRGLVPLFKMRKSGAIVTIASNAAHVPRVPLSAYCASKAALCALARCVGLELAPHGVRCNVISPGSTDTPMQRALWHAKSGDKEVIAGRPEEFRLGIPLGKIATAKDIANLAVFLASDLANHITLQDIVVDGGATLGL